jgi:hypothetical protein
MPARGTLILACAALALAPTLAHADAAAARTAARIAERNAALAREGLGWRAGANRFTTMTPTERERYRMPAGWDPAVATGLLSSGPPVVTKDALPATLDWRDFHGHSFVTPVRNQGQCGSCWAFGTVAAVEAVVSYRESQGSPTLDLAEEHLLDCVGTTLGCSTGGITWDLPFIGGTASFMTDTGVTTEQCYPYVAGASGQKGSCGAASLSAACEAAIVKAESMTPIQSTAAAFPQWDPPTFTMDAATMLEVKTWLQDRPVGCSMRAFDDLYDYSSGVYEPSANPGSSGLHVVLIVGYDDPGGHWIVKNSWGDDFGEDGYFRVKYNTSSIGMYSFVYGYRESSTAPAFCPDLPVSVTVDGGDPTVATPLTIANCGNNLLHWNATVDADWLVIESPAGHEVQAGAEVRAGTTYRLRARSAVGPHRYGTLVLAGASNGPVTIDVETVGTLPPDGGAAGDGGGGGDDGDGGGGGGGGGGGCRAAAAPGTLAALLPLALLALRRRRR